MKRYRRTLALITVAMLAVGATFAAAAATAEAKKGKGPGPQAGKNAIHVDITAIGRDGKTRTLAIDKGKVTGKSTGGLTVTRSDTVGVALTVDAKTRILSRAGRLTLEQLAIGAEVIAFSSAGKALLIVVKGDKAAQAGPNPGKGERGKGPKAPRILRGAVHAQINVILEGGEKRSHTLDRGEITSVSATSVTIKRPDNVSVTLGIDANTKIRKRGDAALANGDRVEALARGTTAFLIRAHAPKS